LYNLIEDMQSHIKVRLTAGKMLGVEVSPLEDSHLRLPAHAAENYISGTYDVPFS
jgi:hypothetical protein